MKQEFSKLYESISMPFDPVRFEGHWANTIAVARDSSHASIEALIRTAFSTKQPPAPAIAASQRTLLGGELGGLRDEEFRLLATGALANALLAEGDGAALVATMICTASFGGLRNYDHKLNLIAAAHEALRALTLIARKRPSLLPATEPQPSVDLTEAAAAAAAEDLERAFALVAQACNAALLKAASKQNLFERALRRYVEIQGEELDMLWWLQGGVSSTTGAPFSSIAADVRPLLLASELAEMTFSRPGAPAIDAILARAGLADSDPVVVARAVLSADPDWLRTMIPNPADDRISPVTTPIHEALKRRLEAEGDETWVSLWATVAGVPVDSALLPSRLAQAFYLERLAIRS